MLRLILIYIIGLFVVISLFNLIVLVWGNLFSSSIDIDVNIWAYIFFNIIYFTWRFVTHYFPKLKRDN